jgi:uncharacterized protein YpmB
MIRKIVIGIILLMVIGVSTGIYLWYKPHPKPKHGIPVTAESLAKEYNTDENASNTKYLGKSLEVTGVVSSLSKNQDGGAVITLDTGDPMAEVQCTLADSTATAQKGQKITMLGFCKGNNMGVILTDCSIK